MNRALLGLFLASLARRRLATALSLLAIALGTALGLAVQLIHGAALDEFGRGLRELAGAADLQVSGAREGFDEALYVVLAQRPEVAEASPLVEVEARLPESGATLAIVGVDLFRVGRVHPALLPVAERAEPEPGGMAGADTDRFAALRADHLFLSAAARRMLGAALADGALTVQAGLARHRLRVAGGVPGAGAGQALGVMDIAAVQDLFARGGRLTRIDLRLAPGVRPEAAIAALRPLLPAGVDVRAPAAAVAEAGALSRAYRVNLTLLAAIALLTGGFLVFSTQYLAVVRRQRELALLRALGLERGTLVRGLLAEGAAVGLAGGALGVVLGHGLAVLAFRVLGGDLGAGYFAALRPTLQPAPAAIATYLALALAAGVAGAWRPARVAAGLPPARGLRALTPDAPVARHGGGYAAAACVLLAGALCLLPPLSGMPVGGYGAVALVLAAAVLALPGVSGLALRAVDKLALRGAAGGRSVRWRLAHARLAATPGQTVVAGAGVVVSVALAAAMAIMVGSFRASVDDWLAAVLPADLYLRASASAASGHIDAAAQARIAAIPGVAAVDPVRAVELRLIDGRPPVMLLARSVHAGWGLPLVAGAMTPPGGELAPAWISEAVADLRALHVGDRLELPIDGRAVPFVVAGVWRDYARQQGAVVIERARYVALTGDTRANDVALRLAPGARADAVAEALRAALGADLIELALPGELRARSLQIFDRTFVVTYLMEAVAVVIGLFGIATTFAALASARRGEFGMLRHLGLRRAEIGSLIALEGALTAALGVGVGLAAGAAVAWVLVEVINRQSFHWSMDLHVPGAALTLFALAMIALAAAVARLAGAHAMQQSAVRAVREDW